jgi:hypothetical protein
MRKRSLAIDPVLAKEAKSITALALRNGPIEELYARQTAHNVQRFWVVGRPL